MKNPAPWAGILTSRKDDDRMKKYELTNEIKNLENGLVLYRIRALKDFADVKAGDLGGFIQKESNLAQDGYAWVDGDACVYGDAEVCSNAWVYGNAKVHGDAKVFGNVEVFGEADVCGNVDLYGEACVHGDAAISKDEDYAEIQGFGSSYRSTTFFRCKDGLVYVRCGCFYGDLDKFRAKVKETHKDSKMAREYLMIADLMELHFKKE